MVQTVSRLSLTNGVQYMLKQFGKLQMWAMRGASAALQEKTISRSARARDEMERVQTFVPKSFWFGGFKLPKTILMCLKQEVVHYQIQKQAQERPTSSGSSSSTPRDRQNQGQGDGSLSTFHSWSIETLHLQSIISSCPIQMQDKLG